MKKRIIAGALSLASILAGSPVQSATFNVSTSAEFRKALIDATANGQDDEIILAKGVYAPGVKGPFTYFSTRGNNLTIRAESGSVEGDVILDGEGTSSILILKRDSYDADQKIILKGLTFSRGSFNSHAERGAGAIAIYSAAVRIENSLLTNNNANQLMSASSIYFDGEHPKSKLSLSHVKILDNTTERGLGAIGIVRGSITISNTEISRNKNTSQGTLRLWDYNTSASITNSIFSENEASNGGAIYANYGDVDLNNVIFKNNTAAAGAGAIFGSRSTIEGSNIKFFGNSARDSGAISAATVILDKSQVTAHKGVFPEVIHARKKAQITNTLFLNNAVGESARQLNGILNCSFECDVINSVFDGNTGGAAILTSGEYQSSTFTKTVANSVFLGNNESVLAFYSTSDKVSVFNNFLAPELPALPAAQVDQRDNILTFSNPGLNTEYAPVYGSVLIDSGISNTENVTLPITDALGNHRIAGDGVDIGMIEFGSNTTAPIVTSISLQNVAPKNLDALVFSVSYELSGERTLTRAELWIDENEIWESEDISDGTFSTAFFEAGDHVIKLRLTDSAAETTIAEYGFTLEALTTEQFVDRIREDEAKLCAAKPSDCGINTQDYIATGIEEGKTICLDNLVSCGANTSKWFEDGKKAGVIQGREAVITQCKNNPADCAIDTGVFDQSLIPAMGSGDWELFGTGQLITDLDTTFAGVQIVWIREQNSWKAFSPLAEVQTRLAEKDISTFTEIPADRGFWVKR